MEGGSPVNKNLVYPRDHIMKAEFLPELSEVENEEHGEGNSESEKSHLLEFIHVYENLPCLWNPANPEYMKKPKRVAALQLLVPIYGKIKQGATDSDVRRKINTLRCNYKKEMNKIEDSKRSGGRLYEPSSWVFHRLHQFLREIDKNQSADDYGQTQPILTDGYALSSDSLLSYAESEGTVISCSPDPFALMSANSTPAVSKKPLKRGVLPEESFKQIRLSSESFDRVHSDIPTIARAWGEKLETLEPHQRLLAEKAINDVLFEASMGTLQRNYVHHFMPRNNAAQNF